MKSAPQRKKNSCKRWKNTLPMSLPLCSHAEASHATFGYIYVEKLSCAAWSTKRICHAQANLKKKRNKACLFVFMFLSYCHIVFGAQHSAALIAWHRIAYTHTIKAWPIYIVCSTSVCTDTLMGFYSVPHRSRFFGAGHTVMNTHLVRSHGAPQSKVVTTWPRWSSWRAMTHVKCVWPFAPCWPTMAQLFFGLVKCVCYQLANFFLKVHVTIHQPKSATVCQLFLSGCPLFFRVPDIVFFLPLYYKTCSSPPSLCLGSYTYLAW